LSKHDKNRIQTTILNEENAIKNRIASIEKPLYNNPRESWYEVM